jgi:ethanolamine ammonia-lyase large subunit
MTLATNYPAGTVVRSYDFAHRQDCYVEGCILGITGYCEYLIRVDRQVVEGKLIDAGLGHTVIVPLNGQPCMTGLTKGVVALDDQRSLLLPKLGVEQ